MVAEDQIRTVIRAFRDRLFTEIFPTRQDVPKTIIFAKDDSHADDIVRIVRQEFDKGNEFCQKITYKTTGVKPEDLLTSFRNSYNPRIVVTVDMIATGTDIKPVEVVFFMRNVRSRNFFEQMKGRGVRTISATDFNAVTPDARNKDRFVIVDAVGVTETELSDSYSLDRRPTVPFDKLLDLVGMGDRDPEVLSSLASRLARLDRHLTPKDREAIEDASHGVPLQTLVSWPVSTPRTLTPLWMPPGRRRGRTTRPNRRLPRPGVSCLRTPLGRSLQTPTSGSAWWTSIAPTSRPSTR